MFFISGIVSATLQHIDTQAPHSLAHVNACLHVRGERLTHATSYLLHLLICVVIYIINIYNTDFTFKSV